MFVFAQLSRLYADVWWRYFFHIAYTAHLFSEVVFEEEATVTTGSIKGLKDTGDDCRPT